MFAPEAAVRDQVVKTQRGLHAFPVAAIAAFCVTLFALMTVDLLSGPRDFLDQHLLRAMQRIDLPELDTAVRALNGLTGQEVALAIWAALVVLSLFMRWWLAALTLVALPIGGLVNHAISIAAGRDRSGDGEVLRAVGDADAFTAAGGPIVGAVLLYGVLFVVADHIASTGIRRAAQGVCIAIILLVGFAEVRHSGVLPSDVTAAYALGGLILAVLVVIYRRIDAVTGSLPLIHAAIPAHDERVPHAHALTSLVLFDGGTVEKIYAPGFLPRLIYWIAFQAEFPYIRNRAALEAARHRRNLAALLTEYWYGSARVARVVAIEQVGDTFAVRSEFVDGHEPTDRRAARAFLADLMYRFERVGYPTWQIDPRQPRAVDNVMEAADGRYMIVDLESGLVSPLASVRTWGRALRRGLVPIYDDVYFDITRRYVAHEEAAMQAKLGNEWTDRLIATMAAAELETDAWRQSEPRLWGHLVYNVQHGFGIRHWPARIRAEVQAGRAHAREWIAQAITTWDREGRLTGAEAATLRAETAAPEFQTILPHLGAHIAISIVLRFPFGGIARFCWTSGALVTTGIRRLVGRTDASSWQQAKRIHTPVVLLFSLLPSIGAFAYLMAAPVRRNPLLVRVTVDMALRSLPFQLYHRSGLQRLIARRTLIEPRSGDTPRAA